ncbi:MAG: hypothetical protein FK733_10650 [Asgard group archaeon]|nr:hypothetical protein [Asgard group archaeon]
MRKNKIILGLLFISLILVNSTIGIYSNEKRFSNVSNTEASSAKLIINDFEDFYNYRDDAEIITEKTSSAITMNYAGISSEYPIYERYLYDFPRNCTDFDVSLKIDFDMASNSDYLTATLTIYGVGHRIIAGGLWDPQAGTTGAWYYSAYPDGIKDQYYTNFGDSGLSGSFYLHFTREGDIVTATHKDGSDTTTLYTYSWSSGLSNLAWGMAVNIYTGTTNSNNSVTFSNLDAVFDYANPNDPAVLFYGDFSADAMPRWNLESNTGTYTYSTTTDELVATSGDEGSLVFETKPYIEIMDATIDATLYYSSNYDHSLCSVYVRFYAENGTLLGYIYYYLSDNEIWSDSDIRKNFRIDGALSTYHRLSSYVSANDRNFLYCLNNYLTGINQGDISYAKVLTYTYSPSGGAGLETRTDDIIVTSDYESPSISGLPGYSISLTILTLIGICSIAFLINRRRRR